MCGSAVDFDKLATDDVHAMAEPLLLIRAEELLTAKARLDAEFTRTLQALHIREVTTAECGRQTRGWLVEEQHLSPAEAGRQLWVAARIAFYPTVEQAMAAGDITVEHARVLIGCLCRLTPDWRASSEVELLEFARNHDPVMLAALCREIRVRAGVDESAEAAEQRRYDSRHLSLATTIDGMMSVSGMLDPESAATVTAALTPLLGSAGEIDDRTPAQRRADALVDLARMALAHGDLPDHGGERPQIIATLPYDELINKLGLGDPGTATLNGLPITAATARRLACDADFIPAVLGGDSEVLDLGHSTPTWSRAQRRARRIEDKGCVFPKCQAPLSRCQIHHLQHLEHHGPTDKANGAHVCHYHHWLVHHRNWTITRSSSGKIEVHRTDRCRT